MNPSILAVLLCLNGPSIDDSPSGETLNFATADLRKMPKVELKVKERGATVVYSGVPLRAILAPKLKEFQGDGAGMKATRALANSVIVLHSTDDYQVAVSAAAVAMDEKGERYLLALERDGKPLADDQGPAKLIVPGDPAHARWIRAIDAIELVRLPKLKPKPKR